MWKKRSTPSKSHNGSWRLACVSSLHKRRFILFSYFLFLHFFRKRLTITSVWRSCARFAWKMRKLIEPFMQTKVRLPSDTLPGAPQWAEQTTLFLVNHSLGEPYIHEKKKKTHGRVIFVNRHTEKTRSSYRNGIWWDFRLSTRFLDRFLTWYLSTDSHRSAYLIWNIFPY